MFDKQLFRCSSLGRLLTNDRSGKGMGLTAQSYLKELYMELKFGIRKDFINKFVEKGLSAEDDSIALYSSVKDSFYTKNDEWFKNDFISGTPDIITDELVVDIKTSWDASTFPMLEDELPNKHYFYQVQGYMWLTGLQNASIAYCLIDTPYQLLEDEKRRAAWKIGATTDISPEFLELCEQIDKNHTFSHIPKELRVKEFFVERDEKVIEQIQARVIEARKYLMTL